MTDAAAFRADLTFLKISVLDLWVTYFGLGGRSDAAHLSAYLDGASDSGVDDPAVIDQALTETFLQRARPTRPDPGRALIRRLVGCQHHRTVQQAERI